MLVLNSILASCDHGKKLRVRVADLWLALWNRLPSDERPYWPGGRLVDELRDRGYVIHRPNPRKDRWGYVLGITLPG